MKNPAGIQNKAEREIEILWNIEGPYKLKNKKILFLSSLLQMYGYTVSS